MQNDVCTTEGRIASDCFVRSRHAERMFLEHVWWPGFHSFDGLHPQYEIRDFKDGDRYIDFAYVQPHYRIAIEIDGFGSHWKNITQVDFADHCQRQNHLVIDQWKVLRFAYHDIEKRPRGCQQTIQQLIGGLTGDLTAALHPLEVTDREIVRLALGLSRPISPGDVMSHLKLTAHAAARHLKTLSEMGWLEPASGSARIRSYRVHPSRTHLPLSDTIALPDTHRSVGFTAVYDAIRQRECEVAPSLREHLRCGASDN